MAHQRTTIRKALADTLDGLATVGSNVETSRVYPVDDGDLPIILVYMLSEVSESETMNYPRVLSRTASFAVEIVTKSSDDLDDRLDTICKEVEVAVGADPTLGAVCRQITLTGTEITLTADGETPMGAARLTYEAVYWTGEDNPETQR